MNNCEKCQYDEICECKELLNHYGFRCKAFTERTPQTHADRLRAMSDEELAEFMCHNVSNGTVNCAFCAAAELCRMGHNGWLDWLQQEATNA